MPLYIKFALENLDQRIQNQQTLTNQNLISLLKKHTKINQGDQ